MPLGLTLILGEPPIFLMQWRIGVVQDFALQGAVPGVRGPFFRGLRTLACVAVLCAALPVRPTWGQSGTASVDATLSGWLDQYLLQYLPAPAPGVAADACAPASVVNALVYLQNSHPEIYGDRLAGTTQVSWAETAAELAGQTYMGTVPGIGTTPVRNLPLGLRTFLSQRDAGFTQVSGVLPQGNPGGLVQALVGPLPEGYFAGLPTVEYLAAVLHAGRPLVASILYEGTDYGHNVLITGIDWTGSGGATAGTMTFVDPLDPAVYDAAGLPVAMKLTTGVFSILPSLTLTNPQTNVQDTLTNVLALDYHQYQGGLPYEPGNYELTRALIGGATVVTLPEPTTFRLAATAALAAFGWTALCRRKSGA